MIIEYRGDHYRAAIDLMRTAAVEPKDRSQKLESTRADRKDLKSSSWPDAEVSPLLWGEMLDLSYAGHSEVAWRSLDQAGPGKVARKDPFRADPIDQLKTSRDSKSVIHAPS